MKVDVRQSGDVIILDLEGRLVGNGCEVLREAMNQVVADGWSKVLLNLSHVGWIDSSGIGELVAGSKLAKRFGSTVKLLRMGDRVKHVLSISRLLPLFEVYESEEEALQSFSAESPA